MRISDGSQTCALPIYTVRDDLPQLHRPARHRVRLCGRPQCQRRSEAQRAGSSVCSDCSAGRVNPLIFHCGELQMDKIFDSVKPYSDLVGRILIAALFVIAGWGKIGGYAGTQQYMESMGERKRKSQKSS